jgi:hypothetical protein
MANMDSCIIFANVYVHLHSIFHQILNVEVIDLVSEGELSVVEWLEAICNLGCLGVVVVKV